MIQSVEKAILDLLLQYRLGFLAARCGNLVDLEMYLPEKHGRRYVCIMFVLHSCYR